MHHLQCRGMIAAGLALLGMLAAAQAHAQSSAQQNGRVYSTTPQPPAYAAPPGGNTALPPMQPQPGQRGVISIQPVVPVVPVMPSAPSAPSRPSMPSSPSYGLPAARPGYAPAPRPQAPVRPSPYGSSYGPVYGR